MTDTGVIYFIVAGCCLFGIVSAYLIYNFVQREKADYYKYILRNKQMKKDPKNYDYVAPKEKKRKLSGPVVAAEGPEKPGSRNGGLVPVPAPLLAPVHLPPVPQEPASVTPPKAVPEPSHPAESDTFTPAAAPVALGGAAGIGAFATYQVAKSNPEPEVDEQKSQQSKNNNKSNKKRRESIKKVAEEDFDDYRNFTPTILPPPKGAPPRANYTVAGPAAEATVQQPQHSDDVKSVTVESDKRKARGMEYPRVSVVNREGLLF